MLGHEGRKKDREVFFIKPKWIPVKSAEALSICFAPVKKEGREGRREAAKKRDRKKERKNKKRTKGRNRRRNHEIWKWDTENGKAVYPSSQPLHLPTYSVCLYIASLTV